MKRKTQSVDFFLFFILLLMAPFISGAAMAGITAKPLKIHTDVNLSSISIQWKYVNLIGTMEIYDARADVLDQLWKTAVVQKKAELPVLSRIERSRFQLSPGDKKIFILVFYNPTDHEQLFFAAPHQATPAKSALGFQFHCLCMNHVYKVPPRQYWYRVVQFELDPHFTDRFLQITHELIATEAQKADPYLLKP